MTGDQLPARQIRGRFDDITDIGGGSVAGKCQLEMICVDRA